jgi:hypothetical protein
MTRTIEPRQTSKGTPAMTNSQFSAAVEIAKGNADLSRVDTEILFGYGLRNFAPVAATVETVAAVIRWDCLMLNGEFDSVALDNLHSIFRRKVTVV